MDDLPENIYRVQPYDQDQAVIEQTAAQLIKDFSEFSFEITFTGKYKTPYEELFQQVLPIMELLLRNNSEMFHALLYRIDVSERDLKRFSASNAGATFPETVTDLILRREMQKVLTRRYFSGNGI